MDAKQKWIKPELSKLDIEETLSGMFPSSLGEGLIWKVEDTSGNVVQSGFTRS
jgi:hypothetical protein